MKVADFAEYPDHCPYGEKEMTRLEQRLFSQPQVQHVLCTNKDLVKIRRERLAGRPLWALEVEAEIVRGRDSLESKLHELAARLELQAPPAAVPTVQKSNRSSAE